MAAASSSSPSQLQHCACGNAGKRKCGACGEFVTCHLDDDLSTLDGIVHAARWIAHQQYGPHNMQWSQLTRVGPKVTTYKQPEQGESHKRSQATIDIYESQVQQTIEKHFVPKLEIILVHIFAALKTDPGMNLNNILIFVLNSLLIKTPNSQRNNEMVTNALIKGLPIPELLDEISITFNQIEREFVNRVLAMHSTLDVFYDVLDEFDFSQIAQLVSTESICDYNNMGDASEDVYDTFSKWKIIPHVQIMALRCVSIHITRLELFVYHYPELRALNITVRDNNPNRSQYDLENLKHLHLLTVFEWTVDVFAHLPSELCRLTLRNYKHAQEMTIHSIKLPVLEYLSFLDMGSIVDMPNVVFVLKHILINMRSPLRTLIMHDVTNLKSINDDTLITLMRHTNVELSISSACTPRMNPRLIALAPKLVINCNRPAVLSYPLLGNICVATLRMHNKHTNKSIHQIEFEIKKDASLTKNGTMTTTKAPDSVQTMIGIGAQIQGIDKTITFGYVGPAEDFKHATLPFTRVEITGPVDGVDLEEVMRLQPDMREFVVHDKCTGIHKSLNALGETIYELPYPIRSLVAKGALLETVRVDADNSEDEDNDPLSYYNIDLLPAWIIADEQILPPIPKLLTRDDIAMIVAEAKKPQPAVFVGDTIATITAAALIASLKPLSHPHGGMMQIMRSWIQMHPDTIPSKAVLEQLALENNHTYQQMRTAYFHAIDNP